MQDTKVVEKILRTLSEKYNYIVCSIEESKDINSLSIDGLQSSLLVHEQKFQKISDEEQVLKVAEAEFAGGRGALLRGFTGRGRGRRRTPINKALIECFKCHKLGHFQYECPNQEKEANYAELNEEEELLLMANVDLHQAKREEVWFLDSGCSNHMTGNKMWFSSLDEGYRHTV